jgi:hypothetical protein
LLSLQLETIFVTSNVDFSLFDKIDNHYRKSRFVGQNVYAPQLDLSASHVSFHSFSLHPFSNLNRLNSSFENHQTLLNSILQPARFFFHKKQTLHFFLNFYPSFYRFPLSIYLRPNLKPNSVITYYAIPVFASHFENDFQQNYHRKVDSLLAATVLDLARETPRDESVQMALP